MNTAITTLEAALSSLRKCGQSDEQETARIEQEIRDHEDALNVLRGQVRPDAGRTFGSPSSARLPEPLAAVDSPV